MIIDRSLGWSKPSEIISRRHFWDGFTATDGQRFHEGTGLSNATLDTALKNLEQIGAIIVTRHKSGHTERCRYSLNREWNPTQSTQKPPRKSGYSPQNLGIPYPKSWGLNKEKEEESKAGRSKLSSPSAPTRIQDTVATALGKTLLSGSDVMDVWRIAHNEVFSEVAFVGWKVGDKANVKRLAKQWAKSGEKETFGVFVEWVVRQWRTIMDESFRWMKESRPPEFPAVGLFVKFYDKFVQAWQGRVSLQRKQGMSARARYIHDLMQRGVSAEIAEQKADERFKGGETLDRIKAEQAKLDAKRRAFAAQQNYQAQRQQVVSKRRRAHVVVKAVDPEKVDVSQILDEFGDFDASNPR